MRLLLIESPGKTKKLQKILGSEWRVCASAGHIRQLSKSGDHALGFELSENRVSCHFEPRDDRAKKTISYLKKQVALASEVIIATDEDREGEVIGWHLQQVLGLKKPKRITYSEITETAVKKALASPRQLKQSLIGAGLARSCLDKIVGFCGSPLLWNLNCGAKSMGRVQSAVLHLVAEREREIKKFVPQPYFSLFIDYQEGWRAFYLPPEQSQGDDSEEKEEGGNSDQGRVSTQEEADRLLKIAQSSPHLVKSYQVREVSKKPPKPFTTSSLQQEAGRRLNLSSEQTMRRAQKLYEQGHITYMRTDSVVLSQEAVSLIRIWLSINDEANLPSSPPVYKNQANSQEAHEAIRPSDVDTNLSGVLDPQHLALYQLIWQRTIASQACPAKLSKSTVISAAGETRWRARGQSVLSPGYLKYWRDLGQDAILPVVQEGATLVPEQVKAERKLTVPPPRYTEPALVQLMEKLGIGRPSTYSAMIKTLLQREYVRQDKKKLAGTDLGLEVDRFLQQAFPDLIDCHFTARMEEALDEIASGKFSWETYLYEWHSSYFEPALQRAQGIVSGWQSQVSADSVSQTSSHSSKSKPKKRGSSVGNLNVSSSIGKCPVCSQLLVERSYKKEGKTKKMLVCSSGSRGNDHQQVVYFQSRARGRWWSPGFGVLEES